MNGLTKKDARGNVIFSPDRAKSFVNSAVRDIPTDANVAIAQLDAAIGGNFAEKAKAIGVGRALAQLDPPTKGRALDFYKGRVTSSGGAIAPFIGSLFSPYVWGSYFIKQGMKASEALQAGQAASRTMLQQLIRSSVASMETQSLQESDVNAP